jgi:hypothetical protein
VRRKGRMCGPRSFMSFIRDRAFSEGAFAERTEPGDRILAPRKRKHLADRRQPLRPKVVTHVLGTFRHPCLRVGHPSSGAPEGIRTPDPQIRSLVLYPAELPAPDNAVRAQHATARSPWRAFDARCARAVGWTPAATRRRPRRSGTDVGGRHFRRAAGRRLVRRPRRRARARHDRSCSGRRDFGTDADDTPLPSALASRGGGAALRGAAMNDRMVGMLG